MPTPTERMLALIAGELALDATTLQPDTALDDIADSLDWAALVTAIEREFGLQLAPEQGLALRRVADLLDLVREPVLVCA